MVELKKTALYLDTKKCKMVVEPGFSGHQLGSDIIWKQHPHPLLTAEIHRGLNNVTIDLV
jgi:hypothetical protein